MITTWLYLRSLTYYTVLLPYTAVWASLGLLIGPWLPYRARFTFIIRWWTLFATRWFSWCCGVRVEVSGREHVPDNACIICSKHQSTWETFYLQTLIWPQAQVIKRELLWIPFFGWAFSLLKPIAINRNDRKSALKQIVDQGRERLKANIWLLIFPEGTRADPGQWKPFSKGAAVLAVETGAPLLPIAHNAGEHWPNGKLIKYPGVIRLVIGPPIPVQGRTWQEVNQEAEQWINGTVDKISAVKFKQVPEVTAS